MKIVSYISSIKAGKRSNSQNPITAALDSIVSAANNSGGEFVAYRGGLMINYNFKPFKNKNY